MNDVIVTCARGWLGTRFHHQGRIKKQATQKGGVDCLGLLVGIAQELGLRSRDGLVLALADELSYSHYPDVVRLHAKLSALLTPVAVGDIQPGDVLLLRIDNIPQHLAIVSETGERLGIIHAYAPAHAVVEHWLDDFWKANIVSAFRVL